MEGKDCKLGEGKISVGRTPNLTPNHTNWLDMVLKLEVWNVAFFFTIPLNVWNVCWKAVVYCTHTVTQYNLANNACARWGVTWIGFVCVHWSMKSGNYSTDSQAPHRATQQNKTGSTKQEQLKRRTDSKDRQRDFLQIFTESAIQGADWT